jgi:hypothetical protein
MLTTGRVRHAAPTMAATTALRTIGDRSFVLFMDLLLQFEQV